MNSHVSQLWAKSGLQSLICLILASFAGLGFWTLETQVQVFSFGDSLFDAQFFPRIVLGLIVVTALLCCVARIKKTDEPIGPFSGWIMAFVLLHFLE